MAEIRLADTASVTLDGSGNGSVRFGPNHPRQAWRVNSISVQVATNTKEATAQVYRGNVSPGSRISGTVSGSTGDTDPDLNEHLWPGEYITVSWTGGDANTKATATYSGVILT